MTKVEKGIQLKWKKDISPFLFMVRADDSFELKTDEIDEMIYDDVENGDEGGNSYKQVFILK